MRDFTYEQISRAMNVDIAQMLMSQGECLKREGNQYRWQRYDSTVIKGCEWYRHSRCIGGRAITFVEHFYNMPYPQAVSYLLNDEQGATFVTAPKIKVPMIECEVPCLSKNMHRTFAYLVNTRKIDRQVVQYFVDEKKIIETAGFHNVGFIGYSEKGQIKYLALKSTNSNNSFRQDVLGSVKDYSFKHIGTDNSLFVFEAPVDMLSYISLYNENWKEHSYVSLGGVSDKALINFLKTNPNVEKVYLCLDNDFVGQQANERLEDIVKQQGGKAILIVPYNKDWNEDLIEIREQQEHGKFNLSM